MRTPLPPLASVMVGAASIASIALGACERRNPDPSSPPLEAAPVDTARITPAEVVEWRYSRTIEADLDGDGSPERLVLASDVELTDSGNPLWEDGHRWALFVAEATQVTLLYAAFVPNGHVEAAVLTSDAGRRHVLVQERTPAATRALVVAYEGPGAARAISEANYHVDAWLPSLVAR